MKTQKLAPSLLGVALIGVALGCDKSSPPSAPRAPEAIRSSPNFSRTSGGDRTFAGTSSASTPLAPSRPVQRLRPWLRVTRRSRSRVAGPSSPVTETM
jgi:hypothetical protein